MRCYTPTADGRPVVVVGEASLWQRFGSAAGVVEQAEAVLVEPFQVDGAGRSVARQLFVAQRAAEHQHAVVPHRLVVPNWSACHSSWPVSENRLPEVCGLHQLTALAASLAGSCSWPPAPTRTAPTSTVVLVAWLLT